MALEDDVQQSAEQMIERIREQSEQDIRGFVSEVLTSAARERATVLDETRRAADSERQKALREESARVRAEVEKTWAAKLRETTEAGEQRFGVDLRTVREQADRHLVEKVASVRAEGQRVLEAALEAAQHESGRALALRIGQVREEAERTIAAELASAPAQAGPESAPVERQTDQIVKRVLEGVRRLDQTTRLTDALDTLAVLAGDEAPRAAVLIVQDGRVRGWRFIGFGPALDQGVDNAETRQVDLEFGEAGIVGRAVVTGESCAVVSGPNGVPGDAEPAFTTLPTGVHALAVPVLVGGQVMAVVYGDDSERRPAEAWRESLELLARHAGHCLEALTAARAAQLALFDAESIGVEDLGPRLPFEESGKEVRQ
ncbi:MAG: hypothetical protein CL477_01835 [Acidobacteria bacterium]|jgi:hypothetical protein|nr:hypothetical protein [Acidobacteriota bacterium]MDP7690947.1 hypothetical protein [Vicinamibacterales bacterium]